MTEDQYAIMNTHAWESGMMHVHPEDLAAGEYAGVKVECARCEDIHPSSRPCPHASATTLELWGYTPEQIAAIKAALNCGACGGDAADCASGCLYDD